MSTEFEGKRDWDIIEEVVGSVEQRSEELAVALAERMERSLIHPNMEPFTVDEAVEFAQSLLIVNPARILDIPGL